MAKVKKETGVTGERNRMGKAARHGDDKATRRGKGRTGGHKTTGTRKPARTRRRKAAARRKGAATKAKGRGRPVTAPIVRVAVKSLDPLRKCGPNTSVQFLYRVDEEVDGRTTPHLVFFDRHGWYCEHGRSCPAVGHARKFNGQIARVS